MSRLPSEWQRLYAPGSPSSATASTADLIDAAGHVRALVLEIGAPADWTVAGALWRAVQTELGLPAPAIAISGRNSFQLWFSLARAVPATQSRSFLEALRRLHLPDLGDARVRLWPQPDGDAPTGFIHAATVPAEVDTDRWSAFVADDLAPVFADEPCLDLAPSEDGQAELLRRLASIPPQAWEAALAQLEVDGAGMPDTATPHIAATSPAAPASLVTTAAGRPRETDPRRFLLDVMNDPAVPMALRIEAAKALLPQGDRSPREGGSIDP